MLHKFNFKMGNKTIYKLRDVIPNDQITDKSERTYRAVHLQSPERKHKIRLNTISKRKFVSQSPSSEFSFGSDNNVKSFRSRNTNKIAATCDFKFINLTARNDADRL